MAQVILALAGVLMNRFEISALMLVDRNVAAKGLLACGTRDSKGEGDCCLC